MWAHQLTTAQEIFEATQNDRLAPNTWGNYNNVFVRFQKWLKSIPEYASVCFENDKFILKNVTLPMLTVYFGDNKFHKTKNGKRKAGDMYSESLAYKIHSSVKAKYSA